MTENNTPGIEGRASFSIPMLAAGIAVLFLLALILLPFILDPGGVRNSKDEVFGVVLLAAAALAFPVQIWYVKSRRHSVGEEGLCYRTGMLIPRRRVIPLDAIRTVTVRQNPLQKLFNTGDVLIMAELDRGPGSRPKRKWLRIKDIPDYEELVSALKPHG